MAKKPERIANYAKQMRKDRTPTEAKIMATFA
jgi:hypothetical protein